MEMFEPYAHAIAALAVWGLMVQAFALIATGGRTQEDRTASGNIKRDYSNPVYRKARAHANALEATPLFVAGTVACILGGADPLRVNIAASVFIVARIAMAFVHIRTENEKLRSLFFAIAFFAALGLGIAGVVNAVF